MSSGFQFLFGFKGIAEQDSRDAEDLSIPLRIQAARTARRDSRHRLLSIPLRIQVKVQVKRNEPADGYFQFLFGFKSNDFHVICDLDGDSFNSSSDSRVIYVTSLEQLN